MIDDVQIIEAAQRAERIKAAVPLAVSTDAIFSAIIHSKPGRSGAKPNVEPPGWFAEALLAMKGQSLDIGQFMRLAGRVPVTRKEARAVGRCLRASGRKPRKCSGRQLFDI